jgi:hypothetical protein
MAGFGIQGGGHGNAVMGFKNKLDKTDFGFIHPIFLEYGLHL